MKISQGAISVLSTLAFAHRTNSLETCGDNGLLNIPTNPDDFDEPAWEQILEQAFPTWATPANGCPRLDAVGGSLSTDYAGILTPEAGKFNPCYYTKAFAGLDPNLGGYPTPIDTHYPYEFAAPFLKQPGDGSTHHCKRGDNVNIGACPKLGNTCGKDCAKITDDYGIGHIPPFVPLAAVKNAYNECDQDVCKDWFDFNTNGCNIKKSKLDELVYEYFGENDTIKYQGPVLIDGVPSNTYFKLEYGGESPACDNDNCRGPHYCSKDVADAGNIWGDFCPYVHTGENSGLYRHPHLALAALELWIANQCMPDTCSAQWLDSPNGQGYGTDNMKATSITWCEMDNNTDPISQPVVPYVWPNSGSSNSIFPGHSMLYGDKGSKPSSGLYVTEFVDVPKESASAQATMSAQIIAVTLVVVASLMAI